MTADDIVPGWIDAFDAFSPTEVVARFVAGFDGHKVSAVARATAGRGYFDCLGVALAGSVQPAGLVAARFAAGQGTGSATVWGQAFTVAPAIAALANGTAAHALDYDDVNWALLGHPSVILVPATLAVGESIGATGAQLIDAYACGFEVLAALGRSTMPGMSFDGGWHATAALGAIGATAAVARLLELELDQVRNAIGIAVSEASGVVRNIGTMTKPLHAGLAAQAGVQAAWLAAAGFTADPSSLEGKHGFYSCFGARSDVKPDALRQLGLVWELERTGLLIKPYPCGVAGHPAIDACLTLRDRLGSLSVDQVVRIAVGVTSYTLDKMRYSWPENELQAKFCVPYQVASTLATGRPTLADFTAEGIKKSAEVRALAHLTELFIDEEIEQEWRRAGGSRPCRVRIELADGSCETELVRISRGNPQNPLTSEELRDKFRDAASYAIGSDQVAELMDMLEQIDTLSDARLLGQLLQVAGS